MLLPMTIVTINVVLKMEIHKWYSLQYTFYSRLCVSISKYYYKKHDSTR